MSRWKGGAQVENAKEEMKRKIFHLHHPCWRLVEIQLLRVPPTGVLRNK